MWSALTREANSATKSAQRQQLAFALLLAPPFSSQGLAWQPGQHACRQAFPDVFQGAYNGIQLCAQVEDRYYARQGVPRTVFKTDAPLDPKSGELNAALKELRWEDVMSGSAEGVLSGFGRISHHFVLIHPLGWRNGVPSLHYHSITCSFRLWWRMLLRAQSLLMLACANLQTCSHADNWQSETIGTHASP